MVVLTPAEREVLNDAERILIGLLQPKEVLMFSLHHGWRGISVSYFTPYGVQHGMLSAREDPTLAGKVQRAIAIRADEEGRAEQMKAERVATLKAELQALGEDA
jgi:hypothetical protein